MKKAYKEPKMEITEFDVEDVITTSGGTSGVGAGEGFDSGDGPDLG